MQDIISFPLNLGLGVLALLAGIFLATVRLALANLSPGAIHRMEESNEKMASGLEHWLRQREELRITLRLLHLLVSVLALLCALSWIAFIGPNRLPAWIPVAAALFFYIVCPEIIAFNLPRVLTWKLLVAAMPVVRGLNLIILPLAWPLAAWHRFVREHWKNGDEGEEKTTREDEIRSLIEQDESSAVAERELESDERRMIRGVFDLDETLVRKIMTPRIDMDAVDDTATLGELRERILEYGHSRVPVYHQSTDQIVGLAYAKDLIKEDLDPNRNLAEMKEFLHAPIFIPETKNVGDLLTEFQQNRSHFAIVIDEYGGTEGVVTLEDIIEEIVGEIHDEYDEAEVARTLPEPNEDGTIVVEGRTSIYELNRRFDLGLSEKGDYETVGGYAAAQLGRIPRPGETIETENGRIQILEADRRRVLKARIEADQ